MGSEDFDEDISGGEGFGVGDGEVDGSPAACAEEAVEAKAGLHGELCGGVGAEREEGKQDGDGGGLREFHGESRPDAAIVTGHTGWARPGSVVVGFDAV